MFIEPVKKRAIRYLLFVFTETVKKNRFKAYARISPKIFNTEFSI